MRKKEHHEDTSLTKQLREVYSSAQKALEQKDQEICAHVAQVDALKDQLNDATTAVAVRDQQIEELKNYADTFVDGQKLQHGRELEMKQDELRNTLEDNARLKAEAKNSLESFQAAERVALELRARVSTLQDEVAKCNSAATTRTTENGIIKASHDELQVERSACEATRREVDAEKNKSKDLLRQVNEEKQRLVRMEVVMKEKDERIDDFAAKAQRDIKRTESLEREIDRLTDETKPDDALVTYNKELRDMSRSKDREINRLKSSLSKSEADRKVLEERAERSAQQFSIASGEDGDSSKCPIKCSQEILDRKIKEAVDAKRC